jgi:NADH-quinone oxidoreductase subunit M
VSGWDQWAVTLAVFLPTAGAVAVALTPRTAEQVAKTLAMVFSGAALLVGVLMLFGFHAGTGLQFEVDASWIPVINANYHVGVDGISLPLLELTLLLSFLCTVYSWKIIPSPGRARGFLALMLILETGMAGTFVSFDLVLFFVFWELVLIPMYFMIGIWGSGNRQYAAV